MGQILLKNSVSQNIEKGIRLKELRLKANISATKLSELTGISRVTLSYWENAKNRTISRKGAELIIKALKSIGYEADVNWLLYGNQKTINLENNDSDLINSCINYNNKFIDSLKNETDTFLKFNPNSIITKVEDNMMFPIIKKGDLVGGVLQNLDKIQESTTCIIKNKEEYYIRNINKFNKKYSISHINMNSKEYINFNLLDITIAPVIRFWRL